MQNSFLVSIFLFVCLGLSSADALSDNKSCTNPNKPSKEVCPKDLVKESVEKMCAIIQSKGKEGVQELKKFRYDCCGGPGYVWIQTADDAPTMIMHPIKPMLDGKDVSKNEDPKHKKLFIEFSKAVKAKPTGDWVDYQWTKFGDQDPTDKISFVMLCETPAKEKWIVGSGTWIK